MISINLLPDVKLEFLKTQKIKYRFISLAVIISIICLALLLLMAIYVKGIQPAQLNSAKNKVKESAAKLSSDPDNFKVVTLQNQLTALNTINSQKPLVSRSFDYMQSIVSPSVSLTSISNDLATKKITIQATTDTLKTANEFSDTLKHAKFEYRDANGQKQTTQPFSAVEFTGLSKGDGTSAENKNTTVSFSVVFQYDPILFSPENTDTRLTVPLLSTAQINQPTAVGAKNSINQNATPFGNGLPANSPGSIKQ